MKCRAKPKTWMEKEIMYDGDVIGAIKLVDYMQGNATPHIEYWVDNKHADNGVMSRELPKYLKMCKKYEVYQMIALVRNDNKKSIHLLEKNGFIRIKTIDDITSYIIDLCATPEMVEKTIKKIREIFPIDQPPHGGE